MSCFCITERAHQRTHAEEFYVGFWVHLSFIPWYLFFSTTSSTRNEAPSLTFLHVVSVGALSVGKPLASKVYGRSQWIVCNPVSDVTISTVEYKGRDFLHLWSLFEVFFPQMV